MMANKQTRHVIQTIVAHGYLLLKTKMEVSIYIKPFFSSPIPQNQTRGGQRLRLPHSLGDKQQKNSLTSVFSVPEVWFQSSLPICAAYLCAKCLKYLNQYFHTSIIKSKLTLLLYLYIFIYTYIYIHTKSNSTDNYNNRFHISSLKL